MSRFARNGDLWSGLVLAALGTYIVSEARRWTYMGEEGPGAGFFPLWYGGVMIVLSLLLVAGAVMRRPPAGAPPAIRWLDLGRALACWLAFVACIALMKVVGFAIGFALLTWFIIAVMARRPQWVAVTVAVVGAVAFQVLFEIALDVALPKGMLF